MYTSGPSSPRAARPAAVAIGLPASVPAWNTGAEGRERLHHLAPAADRADRQTAADHLAERREVGRHVVLRLGTAACRVGIR